MRKNKNPETIQALLSAVNAADSILLFPHIAPDGDALGSVLALAMLLKGMDKQVTAVLDGTVPRQLQFLPCWELFVSPDHARVDENTLAIAVDVSCSDRMGACEALYHAAKSHAVIDHHGTNVGFGEVNWIDATAPATAVLIYRLYRASETPISKDAALCLYTALSTDTGNFIYESVNAECFEMMEGLMEAGLELAEYSRLLFRTKEVTFVRLLSETLPTLRLLANGKIAGLQTSMEKIRRANADPNHVDGVVDYAIDLEDVCMAYYAHEKADGSIKFSLRSIAPYRVDQVAAQFGGGGHKQAAGCGMKLPIDQAVEKMEAAMTAALEAQRNG